MLLGYNVVTDRQAEARALAGWLGGEEWLEELVFDFRWNANAVVTDVDFNRSDPGDECKDQRAHLEARLTSRVELQSIALTGTARVMSGASTAARRLRG